MGQRIRQYGENKPGKPCCIVQDFVAWPRILERNVGVRDPGSNSSSQVNNNLTLSKLLNLVFFYITRGLKGRRAEWLIGFGVRLLYS